MDGVQRTARPTERETLSISRILLSFVQRAAAAGRGINKDRTAGDRTTVRLSNGYSLLRQQENAVDIASGLPVQPKGVAAVAAVAASGVSCGRQVTDLESFLRFFLLSFYSSFSLSWPSVNFLVLRTHFWPFTEVMRKGRREVTRKSDGSMVARSSFDIRVSSFYRRENLELTQRQRIFVRLISDPP